MAWIDTKPPLSYSDVDRLIQHIQASNRKFVAGIVLATALKFTYCLALRKSELLCLTVGHVFDHNLLPLSVIRIRLPRQVPAVITALNSFTPTVLNYLPHLQNLYGADFGLNVPLFPNRQKQPYNDTNFAYHLDILTKPEPLEMHVNLEKVRKTGICKYYDDLKAMQTTRHPLERMNEYDVLERTARFARTGERHTIDLLNGDIKAAGDDSKRKARAKAAKRMAVDKLSLRLKDSTMLSAAEIMKIIEELYHFPTRVALDDFLIELANAIQQSALNESEVTEIAAYFRSKLYDLGFEVKLADGKILPREYTLTDE